MTKKTRLNVLSLGAGVQSSTLALMIEEGLLPMVDCAIFSDTKAEPKEVYTWLEWLQKQVSYPIYKVSFSNLKQDCLTNSFNPIPAYTLNSKTKKIGILRRQCTLHYKIKPIHKKIRELLGLKKGKNRKKGTRVNLLMGISYDEMGRMKENIIDWVTNTFPLVKMKFKRSDCLQWFLKRYDKIPPRSACTFCPYKTNEEWLDMKTRNKSEWEDTVNFDKRIRESAQNNNNNKVFLHYSCQPLDEIDFTKVASKKYNDTSILDECDGMCGV